MSADSWRMSELGQTPAFKVALPTSGLPRRADVLTVNSIFG
jgi:hypothetical protein